MKEVTIIATLPPNTPRKYIKKLDFIKNFLKEEMGIIVNLVVTSGIKEGRIIVWDDVIELNKDAEFIIKKIAAKLSYDVGDYYFMDKVAAAAKAEFN
jgi:hypothetical protein